MLHQPHGRRSARTQRNHVCLRCFPIQLSKNRPRRKGAQSAKPLRPCQAECFRCVRLLAHLETIPSDPDTSTTRVLLELERSGLPRVLQGPAIVGPTRGAVNCDLPRLARNLPNRHSRAPIPPSSTGPRDRPCSRDCRSHANRCCCSC